MKRRTLLRLAAGLILCFGVSVSAWLYLATEDDPTDVIGYLVVDGQSYPVTTRDSKRYRHDLERFGGKMAVFADDLNRWFRSLMAGRRLALVIGLTSVGAAFFCFRASREK